MVEWRQREVDAAGKQYTGTVRAAYQSGTKRAEKTQQLQGKEEAAVKVEHTQAKEATEQDTDAHRVPDQAVASCFGAQRDEPPQPPAYASQLRSAQ